MAKHRVWHRHGIRLCRTGNLYNVYVLAGDVAPELALVEPAEESWTRLDDGDQVEQDQADQLEELKRVSAARRLQGWKDRSISR